MSLKTERLIMRVTPEFLAKILAAAARDGENKSAWVERAIRTQLGENDQPDAAPEPSAD